MHWPPAATGPWVCTTGDAGDPDPARKRPRLTVHVDGQVRVDVVGELLGRPALDPVDACRSRSCWRGEAGPLLDRHALEPDAAGAELDVCALGVVLAGASRSRVVLELEELLLPQPASNSAPTSACMAWSGGRASDRER